MLFFTILRHILQDKSISSPSSHQLQDVIVNRSWSVEYIKFYRFFALRARYDLNLLILFPFSSHCSCDPDIPAGSGLLRSYPRNPCGSHRRIFHHKCPQLRSSVSSPSILRPACAPGTQVSSIDTFGIVHVLGKSQHNLSTSFSTISSSIRANVCRNLFSSLRRMISTPCAGVADCHAHGT